MNRPLMSLALLAAAGCAPFASTQELQEVSDRVDKFNAQTAQKNDMQALLYEEVVKQNKSLTEKMLQTESLTKALEDSVRRLEDQIKTLVAQAEAQSRSGTPPAAVPGGAANPEPVKAQLKLEDILREIEVTLSELRNGKLKPDEAAARLRIHAAHAAPKVVGEIRDHFANLDYAQQLEGILARLPAAELKVPLQHALQQRATRESGVRVVGAVGDKELSRILEALVADPDEDFRLAVGESLVKCRNSAGLPLLVGSLKSAQGATRLIAISALKKVNRGEDLGFRAQAPLAQNAAALKAWDEWLEKFGKALFE